MLNYSNPASIVAEACRVLRPKAKVINICDMPVGTRRRMAYIVGKEYDDLDVRYFGLNHFGWWTSVKDKTTGEDYMPKLINMLLKTVILPRKQSKHSIWMQAGRRHTEKRKIFWPWIHSFTKYILKVLYVSGLCSRTYRSKPHPCR